MRKSILIIFVVMILNSPSFSKSNNGKRNVETKQGCLYDYKDTLLKFDECDFYVRLNNNYKCVNINYQSKSYNKHFSLLCISYVEQLRIIKTDENMYWFACESLGFEQYFIWNLSLDKVYEPFFDMRDCVNICCIDYNNQVLFGDTWNSDKGVLPDQKVELYLFSTSKQIHYKVAEKYGDVFSVSLLENNKIQYNDGNNSLIQFDYSAWIDQAVAYTSSSFLIEGTIIYGPDNLSSKRGIPWASANGYGIGDKINIEIPRSYTVKLGFYNGFQSDTRPDLYKANSRAKKVEIRCLETNEKIQVELNDSKEKQIVDLKKLDMKYNTDVNLEITILEVYPGEKYKDLCIQAIIPEY